MALIKTLKGISPKIAQDVFLAETAVIIGDVEIGEGSSIWYGAVLRGDVDRIRIGKRTNIQDLAMVHCSQDWSEASIGNDVTVGHGAVIHGCEVKDCCLIGMNAVVLDKAVVGPETVVGAGAVVLEGMVLESGWIYAGIPARKVKELTEKQKQGLRDSAAAYGKYAAWYQAEE
ncbi:MAG TPA: gamma carbonic anhydrase family protein [Bacteroidetes bacterium]|nr:gamma carbonic anhydrase family protein [Bacteroidota bacterium]